MAEAWSFSPDPPHKFPKLNNSPQIPGTRETIKMGASRDGSLEKTSTVPEACEGEKRSFIVEFLWCFLVHKNLLPAQKKGLLHLLFSNSTRRTYHMNKIYTFVQEELAKSKEKIIDVKSDIVIFVPSVCKYENKDVVLGTFMLPDKLYWHDATGCVGRLRDLTHLNDPASATKLPACLTLSNLYPGLYDFLVTDCGVPEALSFCAYLSILRHLSYVALPSEVAHEVFWVFLKWADDLKSGLFSCDEINDIKYFLLKSKNTVLPTIQDTWVSLNPTFDTVCWTDDDERMEQFKDLNDVHILQFGELTTNEREMLCGKVSIFMQNIGIPALAEGNIFYITPNTDSHELFLELSRLFFHGLPNLHIANFLHIITTKVELGHTEEQIEPFIIGSYKEIL
ncbi:hypothetical protein IEQ34_021922 [Dendrobium chrysotoxum]|uniref:Uncharacterized protein n=1 Tax=Dendrobium chrysotoxum TaxID=161865 RepID=A0AAV7FW70_DENCH|nr:hypothetical protein IEQ34_021922 [Dendrobium chrysotoxum]